MKTAKSFRRFFARKNTRVSVSNGQGPCGCGIHVLGNPDGLRIVAMFQDNGFSFLRVQDGRDERFKQPTPKARILAALDAILAKEGGGK